MKDKTSELEELNGLDLKIKPHHSYQKSKQHFSTKLEKMNALLEEVGIPKAIHDIEITQQMLSFQGNPIRRIWKEENWFLTCLML